MGRVFPDRWSAMRMLSSGSESWAGRTQLPSHPRRLAFSHEHFRRSLRSSSGTASIRAKTWVVVTNVGCEVKRSVSESQLTTHQLCDLGRENWALERMWSDSPQITRPLMVLQLELRCVCKTCALDATLFFHTFEQAQSTQTIKLTTRGPECCTSPIISYHTQPRKNVFAHQTLCAPQVVPAGWLLWSGLTELKGVNILRLLIHVGKLLSRSDETVYKPSGSLGA